MSEEPGGGCTVSEEQRDPKVVMDLPIFKIGEWNDAQRSNRSLWEESMITNRGWNDTL